MSFFYNKPPETPLALPHGYNYNPGIELRSNHQYFLAQEKEEEVKHNVNQETYHKEITFQNDQQASPHRNRIFDQPKMNQTRNKSTPGKRHRIFDQEESYITEYKPMIPVVQPTFQVKSQLLQQVEITKYKAELYSGPYSQLLQKLIRIIDTKQDKCQLQFDAEFNDTMFKIRTLSGLDIADKIQIEKITSQIMNQNDKLQFQGVVKELIPSDWMFWIEPLYFEVQRQQIERTQWKSFIMSQKQLYNV